MVERRSLTPEFINELVSPKTGERWVADTKIRGFGIRLWSSKRGDGAAFGVRTSNLEGKAIRKTFDPFGRNSHRWRWYINFSDGNIDFSNGIPMGFFLDDARRWARKVIGQAKGRIPTDDEQVQINVEDQKNREQFSRQLQGITLERAADIILFYGPHRGWSDTYTYQMKKLFHSNVPERLKRKLIKKITRNDIENGLSSEMVRPSNARALRSLLHQIFERVSILRGPEILDGMPGYAPNLYKRKLSKETEFINSLKHDDFIQLFQFLEEKMISGPNFVVCG